MVLHHIVLVKLLIFIVMIRVFAIRLLPLLLSSELIVSVFIKILFTLMSQQNATLKLQMLYGMAKKLTKQMAATIAEFVDELGLVPMSLVTREVLELIHQSWEREFQQQRLNELEKQVQKDFLLKLRERSKKRLPQKVLDNMQPININPLLDV